MYASQQPDVDLLLNPGPGLRPLPGESEPSCEQMYLILPLLLLSPSLLFLGCFVSWLISAIFTHSFIPQICTKLPSCIRHFGSGDSEVSTQAWCAPMELWGHSLLRGSSRTSCLWFELAVPSPPTDVKLYMCPKESEEGRASGIL